MDADPAGGSLHVLHVDDDPPMLDLVEKRLLTAREGIRVTSVERPDDALATLADVDCVVSDYRMPGMDGLEFLAAVREREPDVPFILFTGEGSEELASEAISAGVDAYVPKHDGSGAFDMLLQRIEALVSGSRAETSYREVFEKAAVAMSIRDPETGRFVDANQQYCELMGYSIEELTDATSGTVGVDEGPYTTERAHDLLRATVESGERTVEWVNERRDGTRLRVESTLKPAEIDGRTVVLVSVHDVTGERERQVDLERKNDLLERTQRLAQVGGWELDADSWTLRWTDEVKRILDLPLDHDPTPESALEFYHPDDRQRVSAAVERALNRGEPFELSVRLITATDELRWVYAQGEPVETDDGGVEIRGTVQDVTERRRREQRIRRLQNRTQELMRAESTTEIAEIAVDTAKDALGLPLSGVHLTDGDGVLSGVAVTDEVREELEAVPEYRRDADADSGSAVVWEVFESGETYVIDEADADDRIAGSPMESGIVHPLGDHGVFITSSPELAAFDEADEALAGMLATTTTTALDRAERQRRYEAIFNRTFQFTGLTDPDGTLLEANRTALEFVDADREEVVGTPLWESPWFVSTEDAREAAREAVEHAAAGEFYRTEIPIRGAEETIISDFSVRPVTDERGEVVLLVPESRDITELKEREAELERTNEQLEEFASVVSHDLRNPLAVASGRLELAREDPAGGDEDLAAVARAHERMRSLIDDLLELARHGRSVDDVESVDLAAAARSAWDNVDTAGGTLRVPTSVRIEAPRDRLVQLFENLFGNSVEHAGPSVTVTVGVTEDVDGFYVVDDGPGIPTDMREAVFDTGTSTREDGTGFGLSIVERIATAHDWSMTATDSADGGARFEVTGVQVADGKTV